jgi:uncharacterized phage-associated protein
MSSAKKVANYIIAYFQEREDLITNLKLQKLLYYVQGWHLAIEGNEAFPEDFQAWVHGPVVREVYNLFKDYRWNPISEEVETPTLSSNLQALIDEVLEVYGSESAFALEQRTHLETPWLRARGNLMPDEASNNVIEKKWMKEFFEELANAEEG